jgi:hypothetical protein
MNQMNAVRIPPTATKIDELLREYRTNAPELAITREKTAITLLSVADDDRVKSNSHVADGQIRPSAASPRIIGIKQRNFAARVCSDRNSTMPAMQNAGNGTSNINSGDHSIFAKASSRLLNDCADNAHNVQTQICTERKGGAVRESR